MLSTVDLIYGSIAILAYSTYQILMKRFSHHISLIILFWLQVLSYLGYLGVYFYRTLMLQHDSHAFEYLIHNFTFFNAPLYLLLAAAFVGSQILYEPLIRRYEISKIIPFLHISTLFTYLGYFVLGDPFHPFELAGALIITTGAFVTALDTISWKAFLHIPKVLLYTGIGEAFLKALRNIIIYFITEKTVENTAVMKALVHVFPFSFYDIFYTNIGTRFFMIICFYWYIHKQPECQGKIIQTLTKNWRYLCLISIVFLISTYAFHMASVLANDQTLLESIGNLNVPIILIMAGLLLHEKITGPKVIGAGIIILGACISGLN